MPVLIQDGALVLYGIAGDDFLEGFTSSQVLEVLSGVDQAELLVRVNSPGGFAHEGIAVFNALRLFPGRVTVQVDAAAHSAASVIVMAGDTIRMMPGAMMMVHDPSNVTFGNAEDHRKIAETLDYQADAVAKIYANRTGQSEQDIRALMKAETWMDGPAAVAAGFATVAIEEPHAAQMAAPVFNYASYQRAPDALLDLTRNWLAEGVPMAAAMHASESNERRPDMSDEIEIDPASAPAAPPAAPPADPVSAPPATMEAAAPVVPPPAPSPSTPPVRTDPAPAPDATALTQVRLKAARDERARVEGIFSAVRAARLESSFAEELISAGITIADAHARIIDTIAEQNAAPETINAVPGRVLEDGVDRFRSGVTASLCAKAGLSGGERNEFSSMTLSELARASLSIRGLKPMASGKNDLVKFAFQPVMAGGMHSTSDFGEILADVASKSMMKGFSEADETFRTWTSAGSLPDFKPAKRVGLTAFTTLTEVEEGAEYTHGTIGDQGEPIVLATYGKLFAITRQAIVNDDLSVFTRIPNYMGRAALRTIGDLVYAVLSSNPAMADGTALFHADHGNLAGSGGAPGMASINDGIVAMVRQKDRDKKTVGSNIRPKFILAPWTLRSVVLQVLNSEYDPSKTTRAANTVRGAVEPVFDARLDTASTTAWYLAADQGQQDTVEVAYLDGVETPTLEQQAGWTIDGAEFKVRIDAGVKALAWEGLYKNAGA
ncbi:MAG: Clp protease ClpP [Roseibium sp.]|nr:Clp protease ClpP [Roseibium sp.]